MDLRVPSFSSNYQRFAPEIRQSVLQQRPEIDYDLNKIRLAILEEVLVKCGLTESVAAELATAGLCIFHGARNRLEPYVGTQDLLKKLNAKYTLATISNGTSEVHRSELGQYFELSVYSASTGTRKPDPANFQIIFNHTGISPAHSVHVGDHPFEDVEIAKKLGMYAIQFKTESFEISEKADRVVSQISAIFSAILELDQVIA